MSKDKKTGRIKQEENFKFESFSDLPSSRESLLEMLLHAGKMSLIEMIDEEVVTACGERYKHIENRKNVRYGQKESELTLGGKRTSIRHQRVRNAANNSEIRLWNLERFKNEDMLNEMRMKQILLGVSTRKYQRSLEAESESFKTRGASKSAVSRGFIAMTAKKLEVWMNQAIGEDYPFIMIDGITFKKVTVVVALGINKDGVKKVLGMREGSTENARVVTDLLQDLIERGLSRDKVKLFGIDGSKALRKAIRDVFGNDVYVQRCQVHKKRNVLDYLPEELKSSVKDTMTQAYNSKDYETALKILKNLIATLNKKCPEAARSLEEGLEETLTLLKLKAPRDISKTLSSTNAIENMNGAIRRTTRNVKIWKDSKMIMRWVCVSVIDAEKNFRKVKGYKEIKILLDLIEKHNDSEKVRAA
jgi:putative transposase